MIISTLNIDWAKTKATKVKIEEALLKSASDIIVVTESVQSLNLPGYDYVYHTKIIPDEVLYEGVDYSTMLKGNKAVRVSIFSKYEAIKTYTVTDEYTSICKAFETPKGTLTIYGTIIGTQFTKKPYAENELNNCIADCLRIRSETNTLCLIGDLNTSFLESEKDFEMKGIHSRLALRDLCKTCAFDLSTAGIDENIDHIFVPKKLREYFTIMEKVFVKKNVLSDHKGVSIEIN
ncbi:MAG: hypothetical protein ABIU77_08210 [Ferruginibacter sp.]